MVGPRRHGTNHMTPALSPSAEPFKRLFQRSSSRLARIQCIGFARSAPTTPTP
jgi:hypothetical protein